MVLVMLFLLPVIVAVLGVSAALWAQLIQNISRGGLSHAFHGFDEWPLGLTWLFLAAPIISAIDLVIHFRNRRRRA